MKVILWIFVQKRKDVINLNIKEFKKALDLLVKEKGILYL